MFAGTARRRPDSAARRRRGGRLARQDRVDRGTAGDARRQRPDRIERRRQRQHAGDRHPPRGRLVADDAAERRRDAARPAGIGAQPRRRHAVRHRNGGAGGTAAGDAPRRAIPRAGGRAVMRIDAQAGERELGHVDAAHGDEAGGQHALHHRRVRLRRRRVGQHLATPPVSARRRCRTGPSARSGCRRSGRAPARPRAAHPPRPPSRAPAPHAP